MQTYVSWGEKAKSAAAAVIFHSHRARRESERAATRNIHDISRIFRSSLSHFCATFREARRLVGVRADMPAASLGAP